MPSQSVAAAGVVAILACAAPALAQSSPPTKTKTDYNEGANWLCRPNGQDACAIDLTTTIIAADGTLTREEWKPNPAAPIDCFYVYPTVSRDQTPTSDLTAGPEERMIVASQLARFGSQCRLYAPMYRQITLAGLRSGLLTRPGGTPERATAYQDVRDAWRYYLDHDNRGRGFVLIGHSQGSFMLADLIHDEIDGKPSQSRLISAILLGTNLAVPRGKDVGGAFRHVPLCHAATDLGCVITYASFRSTIPPPENTLFGRVPGDKMEAACTNPAALRGGSAPVHAYMKTAGNPFTAAAAPNAWVTPAASIDTPFVSVPGLLTAQCVSNEHGSYLEVTVHGDPADPRADDIPGDVMTNGKPTPSWGLHLIDVNLTIGNLVDLVRDQTTSFLAKKSR